MELFNPNSKIDFMRWGKVSLGVAVAIVVIAVAILSTRGLTYGLDFTGGTSVEVGYEQSISVAEVRAALTEGGFDNAVVQTFGGTNDFAIRIVSDKADAEASEESASAANDKLAASVLSALREKRPDAQIKSSEFVGAQVGEELRNNGLIAVLFVVAGITIYLWIRFEWRFAVAAIASEVHDVLFTVAIFALTGREFDLPALAAVLSVIGYSINDTIVVFDRVRESFRSSRKGIPSEVLNRSINTTLSRTIMTSLTTALAVGTLYFIGGPALESFGLIMLIGILIGTLSSIFIANPLILLLGVSKQDLMPMTKDDPALDRRP
ncbi:MAG TPA: protein translocase subunit SecF [Dokdonella sp.]|uniref:protein translocase subunit SecF n=1 Tax=Dokdonella sp. TaxID=2291710 RepID=UPI002D7FD025|nr:protein translocase subunit SecF [Dokdonella sp.]HET9034008.1 protein translocase subunit SecF [Dokdonella sp.]